MLELLDLKRMGAIKYILGIEFFEEQILFLEKQALYIDK
jgi:hypothetical protein